MSAPDPAAADPNLRLVVQLIGPELASLARQIEGTNRRVDRLAKQTEALVPQKGEVVEAAEDPVYDLLDRVERLLHEMEQRTRWMEPN